LGYREKPERGYFLAATDKLYPLPRNDSIFHYIYQLACYDHDEGNALSGGFVYNGKADPLLRGKYIFGDIVNGRVFCVETNLQAIGKQASVEEAKIQVDGKRLLFSN
jgi:hypothetical protein